MNNTTPQTTAGGNNGQGTTVKNGSVENAASKIVKALTDAFAEVHLAQPLPHKHVYRKRYRHTHLF